MNVKQIPNPQNSAILNEWIENSFLIDIFRQLYPERKVYSHIPFNKRDFSRTRIDFWLVSDTISNNVREINYLPLISKLFYHKPVQLVFKSNSRATNFINPKLLKISGLEKIAKITTLDTYLDYIAATNENQNFLQLLRNDLTSSQITLALLKDLLKFKNEIPTDKLLEIFISNCCHSIDLTLAPYNQMEIIHNQSILSISSHLFMQTLLNNLQLEIITHQKYHTKCTHVTQLKQKQRLHHFTSLNPPPHTTTHQDYISRRTNTKI